ncbi:ABC transporter permease [Oscillochloris sp. ZM17-4]|uniref:ABC transporter permease n=1 Tax=Oscillochloris sp. ZM17-4 TaxID=2866714 RepID=UPI001C73B9CD|nr:ABC transporter permease [Oscillochloris sp. ZM17-4]MBX0327646.1 ABC transporter permease [Oscillochloris sp. ZM17-4]
MQQTLPIQRMTTEPESPQRRRLSAQWVGLPATIIGLLAIWQAAVSVGGYRAFILPAPGLVLERLASAATSGILWQHSSATLVEALGGFGIALALGLSLGYVLAHIPWLERALSPVLAASQSVPVLAVAPLIILWFGPGLQSKLLIAALITFLPILLSTVIALRGIPRELREMALISGASRWQMLRYVEAYLALPVIFGGVRTGLALATTGAVVGEFVAGRDGLGALINIARGLFDTPLIFVALITLAAITLGLYLIATLLERLLVTWEA